MMSSLKKTAVVLTALFATVPASAQISFPSSLFGLTFSTACQGAIIEVLTNGSFSQCFHAVDLLPILTSNGSIIPILDNFMSDVCYNSACSNDTLQTAASQILAGCTTDLTNEGLNTSVVTTAFSTYPLVREVLCLKTVDPYTNTSYNGSLGSPPIPITSTTYNSTNGTFCVTSVLTQLSAYFGSNLSLSYIESVATGQNTTALGLVKAVQPNILCNDCVFGALDVVEEAYPAVGSVPIASILGYLNLTSSINTTINGLVNSTCAYDSLYATDNGTLPANISVSIVNSTFPYNITTSSMTMNATMMKRMFGLS